MSIIMDLDIEYETNEVVKIIKDDTFDKSLCTTERRFLSIKQGYLLNIIIMTMEYPKIETYLKNLLIKFSIGKLQPSNDITMFNNIFSTELMFRIMISTDNISLNALEIIIKYGINVNHRDIYGNTLLHHLFHYDFENGAHNNNILNLFIKYGADLNIINSVGYTILDKITQNSRLTKQLEICIMTLLDNGAKFNKPGQKEHILNFIESYRYNSIKPAIKNESNI